MRSNDDDNSAGSHDWDSTQSLEKMQLQVRKAIVLAKNSEHEFVAYLLSMSLLEISRLRQETEGTEYR